ncbi:glutaredoxin 3 [Novosphingobium sp. Fuku2-ISO-50]|uniref:glutaredoxin 3 n=1 Tax=Novosphingobium sp. Fuku2-ISO-50 TaxID=1739114 RepID=UPI00076CB831|nr:glutaredoxin 3 [Novosphingobium sp. Fuku2-ISO-50]KUR79674.1 glutaredoxin [Novosphingobium sp. Fuku2-ISO-50]
MSDADAPQPPLVEIYTKWGCPYCYRAKALLEEKGVALTEYDITMGGPKRAEMLERAPGRTTVPQIFIDGRLIGGCDDLMALDAKGGLDPLLGQ